jgi:hypothetical protein
MAHEAESWRRPASGGAVVIGGVSRPAVGRASVRNVCICAGEVGAGHRRGLRHRYRSPPEPVRPRQHEGPVPEAVPAERAPRPCPRGLAVADPGGGIRVIDVATGGASATRAASPPPTDASTARPPRQPDPPAALNAAVSAHPAQRGQAGRPGAAGRTARGRQAARWTLTADASRRRRLAFFSSGGWWTALAGRGSAGAFVPVDPCRRRRCVTG